MWIVAGILLGSVTVGALVGIHSGPHTHAVAGVVGLLAAAWLVVMAVRGGPATLVWALFSADVVISLWVGLLAWWGLTRAAPVHSRYRVGHLQGAEGLAVTELAPDGIIKVRGEQWSATAANGPLAAGTRVVVLSPDGVRLEVWGEEASDGPGLSPPITGPATPHLAGRPVTSDPPQTTTSGEQP